MTTVRIGDLDFLVEATQVPKPRPTSTPRALADRPGDVFDEVDDAMCAVARSAAQVVEQLAMVGTKPARIEVQFGLKVAVEGQILVAAPSDEATLRVSVRYEPEAQARR